MKNKPWKKKKPAAPIHRTAAPESVADILGRMIKTSPLGDKIDQAQIWENWPDLAGKTLHPHGSPRGIRDNTLIVEVESTVWLSRFSYDKWNILQRINKLYYKEIISDIFFVLAPDSEA